MNLPVDIPEIFRIAKDMQAVQSVPVCASVIIDSTADGDLAGHVRAAFASPSANTRVTVTYLEAGYHPTDNPDDFAVIVAGTSDSVGALAQTVREAGVPVMVVSNNPMQTAQIANSAHTPIPNADIIIPVQLKNAMREFVVTHIVNKGAQPHAIPGEIALNAETFKNLDDRMGEWIITTCPEKKLSLAYSFPFIRRPLSNDAITATALQNAAVGIVPILPGADMPIMTLNQMKMVLQIATAYGQPLDAERVKELACVLGGAFLARNIARSGAKLVPFAGWLVSGAVGYAATEAMGRAAVEYFEAGGDLVGVAQVIQTARDGAVKAADAASNTTLGRRVVARASEAAPKIARSLTDIAGKGAVLVASTSKGNNRPPAQ